MEQVLTNSENLQENNIENLEIKKQTKRIKSIDRFRGFCVFAMLVFQFLKNFPSLGILSRLANHSLTEGIVILPGMTIADIIAPSFIFAIGLTYALSFNKWKNLYGLKNVYIHFVERGLSLIGIGGFLATCNKILDSFSGYKFNTVDIIFIVLSSIALAALVFKLVCLIPVLNNKIGKLSTNIFYIALSVLGFYNLVIAGIDFFALLNDINTSTYGYWVTLQNIGMACLVTLPLIQAKNWLRFLVASVIFVLYTVFHQIGNHQQLLDVVVHGGFLGGFGWGAMLIFDVIVADIYFKDKSKYISIVALFAGIGVWSTFYFGNINLGSCSPAFILTSVGLSGLLFYLFHLCDKLPHFKFDPLIWWGKNPLLMFLVEFFVIGLYSELVPDSILSGAPLWLAIIEGVVAVILLTLICYLLNKSKKSFSL